MASWQCEDVGFNLGIVSCSLVCRADNVAPETEIQGLGRSVRRSRKKLDDQVCNPLNAGAILTPSQWYSSIEKEQRALGVCVDDIMRSKKIFVEWTASIIG